MNAKDFIVSNVQRELVAMGATSLDAKEAAQAALDHYRNTAKFSQPVYESCLNHAGKFLQGRCRDFKFKKPRRRQTVRKQRPQEAWGF